MPDRDLSSLSFDEGYDVMTRTILNNSDLSGDRGDVSVNILGYGISDMGWETGSGNIRNLLSAMGIDDVRFIGCRDGDTRGLGSADLDVMVHPQRSAMTAAFLSERYGIGTLRPSQGAPVGYSATRSLVEEVGMELDLNPQPALDIIDREERDVRMRLLNLNMLYM